jgi:hypothetical protein
MNVTLFTFTLFASLVSAREFALFDDENYNGNAHREIRNTDGA